MVSKEFKESIEQKKAFMFNVNFNNAFDKVMIQTTSVWKSVPNFISTGSFTLNKNSTFCSDKDDNCNNTSIQQQHYFADGGFKKFHRFDVKFLKSQQQQQQHQQIRTFKTYRSIISENQRNPTILSRLKDAYNQAATTGNKIDGNVPPQTTVPNSESLQTESFTKALNQYEANLTPDQKHQLKVAFATGYMAASQSDNPEKGGRTSKYLKVLKIAPF
jgi:glutamate synthase domain-containing protein 2